MTDLHGFGFMLADIRLSDAQCDYLLAALPSVADQRGGGRGLLSHPTVLQLIRHRQLGQLLRAITARELVAVSARLLDSVAPSSGPVRWHQDRVVAVRERMDVNGFGPWTTRAGVAYVEPPSSVLEQMVVARVHLDACASGADALHVVPGSHRAGKLTTEAIQQLVAAESAAVPGIARGVLVLMRPLLLHAGLASTPRAHYRVLHIEFAPAEAISPLQWRSSVSLCSAA